MLLCAIFCILHCRHMMPIHCFEWKIANYVSSILWYIYNNVCYRISGELLKLMCFIACPVNLLTTQSFSQHAHTIILLVPCIFYSSIIFYLGSVISGTWMFLIAFYIQCHNISQQRYKHFKSLYLRWYKQYFESLFYVHDTIQCVPFSSRTWTDYYFILLFCNVYVYFFI